MRMQSQKLTAQLNLALNLTEEERNKSISLEVGYDAASREWELIVRYINELDTVAAKYGASVSYLLGEYAIVTIKEEFIPAFSMEEVVIYVEKPNSIYFETLAERQASCINRVQTGQEGLSGKQTLVAVIDSGIDYAHPDFRKEDGSLLFRPAGHGALIYNLNNLQDELVSIKNIDNVSNDRFLGVTARYKKVLMGRCLELRDIVFGYLRKLDAVADVASDECQCLCDEIESFLDSELCIQLPLMRTPAERVALLRSKLDRPIRVCGMVRNQGEPGGGPFIIAGKDGSSNLQILESVQINMDDERSRDVLSRATHFNPVDLVCCIRNYKGDKFNLLDFVDEDAGFISSKSYQGRELKALELPGLWNGSMSDWNTCFVEVPLDTFNPVKVVLDLLRPAHQG